MFVVRQHRRSRLPSRGRFTNCGLQNRLIKHDYSNGKRHSLWRSDSDVCWLTTNMNLLPEVGLPCALVDYKHGHACGTSDALLSTSSRLIGEIKCAVRKDRKKRRNNG